VNDWDYADLVEALSGDSGSKGAGFKAATACELNDALAYAKTHSGGPVLIECLLDKFDCSLKLLEWGQRLAVLKILSIHLDYY
jgi:TPP-dependent 2-oxoacid decarboxylase